MYLAAIIPGPSEPHLTDLNHYIAPVIDMFVDAWDRGIHHSRTALHSDGRVSRSAIAAAVMDLVAARKTSQLASHSSHFFCHVCSCYHQSQRGRHDFETWTRRDVKEMRRHAEQWRDAGSRRERDQLFKANGVRWSELWRLPYWDPTRQLVVDPMHCLYEGLVPYHFRDVLGLTSANANETIDIPPAFDFDFDEVDASVNASLPEKERLSDKEAKQVVGIPRLLTQAVEGQEPVELEKTFRDLCSKLTRKNLKPLKFVADSLRLPTEPGKPSKRMLADALLLWQRAMPLNSSGKERRKVATPEVLERIRAVISETDSPSWLASVPKNFGDAAAGTLKAHEWRILCTVYLPLALISLWGDGSSMVSADSATWLKQVLDHTMMLVSAVTVVSARVMTQRRAAAYRTYIASWVRDLKELHPTATDRTNNHVAFHIYDFLVLFGPVYSWWCFPFERLIGYLQRLPQNHKFAELEGTLLRTFVQASKLRRWLGRGDCPAVLQEVKRMFHKAYSTANFSKAPQYEDLDFEADTSRPSRRYQTLPSDLLPLLSSTEIAGTTLLARYKHCGTIFARTSTHVGNSLIHYYPRAGATLPEFAVIRYIYASNGVVSRVTSRVVSFRQVDYAVWRCSRSPVAQGLNCTALYAVYRLRL
ncbi:hypothetical protein C8Q77DRAFT_1173032 [Trametes polyzona]|nr:hypothetical protein C8Q77DRAFT_1173032 [Trametes polyzona]